MRAVRHGSAREGSKAKRVQGNKTRNPHWAGINRLIERGDIDLISQLFASANWPDGAASTDLSGYFTKDFRKCPRDFQLRLGKEPYAIRNKVYYLFMHDEMLSKEDVRQIREQLLSLSRSLSCLALPMECS